jgi:hypothetical protein
MTLILTLGNSDQVIQVSDRRRSWDGVVKDDEPSKAGLLKCPNARSISRGLANNGAFSTRNWLLETLAGLGPPDYWATNIVERLRLRATESFRTQADLGNCLPARAASPSFSRVIWTTLIRPCCFHALLANYQSVETGKDGLDAWDQFASHYWEERRPQDVEMTMI